MVWIPKKYVVSEKIQIIYFLRVEKAEDTNDLQNTTQKN
jgi:hypothetical protein